jgi:hypothetical protein
MNVEKALQNTIKIIYNFSGHRDIDVTDGEKILLIYKYARYARLLLRLLNSNVDNLNKNLKYLFNKGEFAIIDIEEFGDLLKLEGITETELQKYDSYYTGTRCFKHFRKEHAEYLHGDSD